MMRAGRSFWTVVHPRFINRELTKADVREIVRRGLEHTQGSYRKLVDLFHLPQTDYKRFLAFLSQHDCHLPFHDFRDARKTNEPSDHRVGSKDPTPTSDGPEGRASYVWHRGVGSLDPTVSIIVGRSEHPTPRSAKTRPDRA